MDTRPQIKAEALLNIGAGGARGSGADSLRAQLSDAFKARGIDVRLIFVRGSELASAARQSLAKAQQGEVHAVIAGGGDGTVETVASVLAGSDVPLGVLPLGTLNHFAKDLGIPTLEEAIDAIAAGHATWIDVGDVNGAIFLNNSSIGLYPYVVLDRDRRIHRRGQSKWSALAFAALRILRYFPVHRLGIVVAEQEEICRTPFAFVGNNIYDVGIESFGRRKRLDQGLLDIYVAKPKSRLALIWLACRALFGNVPATDLDHWTAPWLDVHTPKRRLLVAVDGEVRVMSPPLHYRSRPKSLLVYAPLGATLKSSAVAYDRAPV